MFVLTDNARLKIKITDRASKHRKKNISIINLGTLEGGSLGRPIRLLS